MSNKLLLYCAAFVVAVLCITFALIAQAPQTATVPAITPMPQDLIPRQEWSQAIQDARKQQITYLMIIVKTTKDDVSQQQKGTQLWHAVRLLGEYRAQEATGPLMDLIDVIFLPVAYHRSETTNEELIDALAGIGKPASKLAIEYLAKDKSTTRAVRYLRVIYLVEGADEGKFMLQSAVSKEQDPERKARLQNAIELFANSDKSVP